MKPLFDAHNHLQDAFFTPRLEQILDQTTAAGIGQSVVNGTSENDWARVASLSQIYQEKILPSFGLHPWYVSNRSLKWLENLQHLLETHPSAGVGECGLDRWVKNHNLDDQRRVLIPQIELAATLNRPLTLHCLQAWGPLLKLLQQTTLPERGFLLHAYSGSLELVPELTELGAYFSFSGYFLHERKEKQRKVFQSIPHERLLIETDAPAMQIPPDLQSHFFSSDQSKNHPANLKATFLGFCDLLSLTETEARCILHKNETAFFIGSKNS